MTEGSAEPGHVWLASYPKSGNTWFRFIWAQLTDSPDLDDLEGRNDPEHGLPSPARSPQPSDTSAFAQLLALDPRRLTADEIDLVRSRFELLGHDQLGPPSLRKTHERWRVGPDGLSLFPAAATRAAVVIVRDPRDVACSWSNHFGKPVAEAVDDICTADLAWQGNAVGGIGRQVLGSWSQHLDSWRRCRDFPVHLIRYESMLADPFAAVSPVLAAVGLDCDDAGVREAIAATSFERLRGIEQSVGFHERIARATGPFFRRGQAGAWREELTAAEVRKIERHHGALMCDLGYELEFSNS